MSLKAFLPTLVEVAMALALRRRPLFALRGPLRRRRRPGLRRGAHMLVEVGVFTSPELNGSYDDVLLLFLKLY